MRSPRRSPVLLLFVWLCAVNTFAQTSPWDKPDPDSPWNKPNPDSPWNQKQPAEESPWAGPSPVGNWIVEYRDYPDVGGVGPVALMVYESVSLRCERAANGGCYLRKVADPAADWLVGEVARPGHTAPVSRKSRGGMLTLNHPFFFVLEGASTTFRPTSATEMSGQWTHGDIRGGKPSPVVWRRGVPRITRVKFISALESETTPGGPPARVRVGYDAVYWGAGTPAYAPQFTVEIYGENLWGHHVVHLPKDVDMITWEPAYIQDPAGTNPVTANVIGVRVQVLILGERPGSVPEREVPKATPGRKTLVFNDLEIPFDLDITGFPGEISKTSKLLNLRYVELRDGQYVPITGELKHGEVFYVEAAFDAAPTSKEYVVKLEWGGGAGSDVRVTPSSDAKVFRSEAIRLQAPVVER